MKIVYGNDVEPTSLRPPTSSHDQCDCECDCDCDCCCPRYNYKAKLGKLGPGGHLTATVESNAVLLRASLLITDELCQLGVESLELTDLGRIKVHATGLGKLNFLYSKIVTWVTSKLHDKIEDAVQKALKDAIVKAGLHMDCTALMGGR